MLLPPGRPVPAPLVTDRFRLEPLGPEHEAEDHAAWTGSIARIRATPGFAGRAWPGAPLTREENRRALARHADEARARTGFAYAVRTVPDGAYAGCVYLAPPRTPAHDVDVRSWVTAAHADLDAPLHDAVQAWLARAWPFTRPDHAPR